MTSSTATAAAAPAPSAHQQQPTHLITQSYYDEVLAENADLFDLDSISPEGQNEAVSETIDQLSSQGMSLEHICTAHPDSEEGREARERRKEMEERLAKLDGMILGDGTVKKFENNEKEVESVVEALQYLAGACSGASNASAPSPSSGSSDISDGDGSSSGGGSMGAYPALVLFQSSHSIFTLMSLLGAIPLPSASSSSSDTTASSPLLGIRPDTTDAAVKVAAVDLQRRERILRATCQALVSILSPPSSSMLRANTAGNVELANKIRSVKAELRDGFVAFDRLVGLMDLYIDAASSVLALYIDAASSVSAQSAADDTTANDGAIDSIAANEVRLNQLYDILSNLAQLATSACGGCEKNKVAFVRAGKKNKTRSSNMSPTSAAAGDMVCSTRDNSGGIRTVVSALSLPTDSTGSKANTEDAAITKLLTSYCRLLAVLCRFDDFRSPSASGAAGGGGMPTPDMTVSSAHDHVLEFNRCGIVPVLHRVTSMDLNGVDYSYDDRGEDSATAELAAAALSATRTLAVNDEIVQSLVAVGVLKSARIALAAGVGNDKESEKVGGNAADEQGKSTKQQLLLRSLTSSSLGLIRNLCGNDEIKTNLCLGTADGNAETSTVLPAIILAMQRYRSDVAVQEHGCATLAAMALRKPSNAKKIIEEGGPMEVLTAMRRHPNAVPVQRQGALAVRNISSRLIKIAEAEQNGEVEGGGGGGGGSGANTAATAPAPAPLSSEVRETFLDLGAEAVLRNIAGKHQGSVDEAYAALRDLGCKVSMVRYDTDGSDAAAGGRSGGRVTRGVTMFGESKAKFNPSFEESDALEGAVEKL